MVRLFSPFAASVGIVAGALSVLAYDNSRTDNIAVYWGQNSYGATSSNQAGWQQSLSHYCQDDSINAIPVAFLHVFFSTGGLPEINMANSCNAADNGVFSGTSLANCQSMAADIKACQAKGKILTLSLGGATGAAVFSSDAQAETFATTVWNLFLGGSSNTRPFGDAVLDGVDLDIEGGSRTGYIAFAKKIKSLSNGASKKYYLTAAPQCVFPDAFVGEVINAVGFDAIYVQFYNNWCGLQNYANVNAWNFDVWDNWAKNTSPNKDVKVFIGAPAASTAAGSGYVDAATLSKIATETRSKYSSFGGVMFWDASQAYANNRIDSALKAALSGAAPPTPTGGGGSGGGGGSSCTGLTAWNSGSVYVGGDKVSYNGHGWTAKWWTQNDTPGGAAGVWTDNGACFVGVAFVPEATEAATLTDSRHVVDKASTENFVVAGTATAGAAEITSAGEEKRDVEAL